MNNPLRTPEDYELFLYTITDKFPSVRHSTLTFVRKGAFLAQVTGELLFNHEIRLVVRERILYNRLPAVIDWYGYEILQGNKNYIGMTHNPIQMIQVYKALILIISIFPQILNITVFLLQR